MRTLLKDQLNVDHVSSSPGISPRRVVDKSILQQCQEYKRDTNIVPHINSLGVGHGGQWVVDAGGGGGHGEQRGDCERHPGRGRLVVQPEGHPWDTDCHEGGDVDGEDVVGELKYDILIIFNIFNIIGQNQPVFWTSYLLRDSCTVPSLFQHRTEMENIGSFCVHQCPGSLFYSFYNQNYHHYIKLSSSKLWEDVKRRLRTKIPRFSF